MTIHDLRRKVEYLEYLGFDDSKKMWVYSFQDTFNRSCVYGLIAGNKQVIKLSSLRGLNLLKS